MNALLAPRTPRTRVHATFLVAAALMYAIDGALVHSPQFLARPEFIAPAATFDLTIGVTLVYWLTVVRRKVASPNTILPVFLACVGLAAITLPPSHRDFVRYARYLGVPFELAAFALIVFGVRRTRRSLAAAGTELDTPERIRLVLSGSGMRPRIAEVFATEVSMFYFALASWRRDAFVPSNASGFSYHRKNGYAALLYALVPLTLVECIVVDLIVRVRHHATANILLVLSVFGAIWLLGLARSVQLRPIIVTRNEIQIRNGLQWRIDVPRDVVERIDFGKIQALNKRTPGYLRGAPGNPNAMITLRAPLRAHGPYGLTRDVTRIGMSLDDLAGFQRAVGEQ